MKLASCFLFVALLIFPFGKVESSSLFFQELQSFQVKAVTGSKLHVEVEGNQLEFDIDHAGNSAQFVVVLRHPGSIVWKDSGFAFGVSIGEDEIPVESLHVNVTIGVKRLQSDDQEQTSQYRLEISEDLLMCEGFEYDEFGSVIGSIDCARVGQTKQTSFSRHPRPKTV